MHFKPVYGYINQSRVVMVLEAVDLAMETGKQEQVHLADKLSIEHVRPRNPASEQDWEPLPSEEGEIIHTFGNLTLLTTKLNSAISNGSFAEKRPEISKQSRLRLNTYFQNFSNSDSWNVAQIKRRTEELYGLAKAIWPYPAEVEPTHIGTTIQQDANAPITAEIVEKAIPDDEIYRCLQQIARQGGTIPYVEVAHMAGLNPEEPEDSIELDHILDAMDEYEYEQGRPLLSAVVVHDDGTPGSGFYSLAGQLGKFTGQTPEERGEFFFAELKAVYEYWKATEG